MNPTVLLATTLLFAPNGVGIPGHDRPPMPKRPASITALAASPKGDALLSGDADGYVRRLRGKDELTAVDCGRMGGAVQAITWGEAGAFLADDAGAIALLEGGEPQARAQHPGGVNALVLGPKGEILASAGQDGAIRFWQLKGGALVWHSQLEAHEGAVSGFALDADERKPLLWSVGWDGKLKSWKWPKASKKIKTSATRPASARKGQRDTRRASKRRLSRPKSEVTLGKRELTGVAFANELLAVTAFDGRLIVLRLSRGKPKPVDLIGPQRDYAEWVMGCVAEPGGRRIVAIAGAEAKLLVLDTQDPARRPANLSRDMKAPPHVAVFTGPRELVVGRFNGTVTRVRLPALGGEK